MKNFALLPLCLLLATQAAPVAATPAPQPAFDGRPAAPASRQPRDVSPFTAVDAAGSMRVILRQGSPQRVEVDASAADQAKVETTVEGSRLRVGARHDAGSSWRNERFEGPVTVYITAPSLTAVGLSGSGNLQVEGPVQASDFKVSLSGSGNLTLPQLTARKLQTSLAGSGSATLGGSCPRHEVSIAGSGNVLAANLRTDDTQVSIAGSGDARVNAAKTLKASTIGSGSVLFSGDPAVSSSKIGSGTVKRL